MSARNAQPLPCRRLEMIIVALALVASTLAMSSVARTQGGSHWVGTWATGLQAQLPPDPSVETQDPSPSGRLFGPLPRMSGQTLRQVVRTSIGGSRVRVVFTNTFGTHPLEIGAALVAVRADAAPSRIAQAFG